jgi:hypothetical protein
LLCLGKFGREHHRSKVVDQCDQDGAFIRRFFGTCEASRETGVPQSSISRCCTGKLNTAGGFTWRYA